MGEIHRIRARARWARQRLAEGCGRPGDAELAALGKMGDGDESKRMLARVVRAPPTDAQMIKRSKTRARAWETRRRKPIERLVEQRKAERWAKRSWRPGKLTGERPVRILVLEALDRETWRMYAEIKERVPAASKAALGCYLVKDRRSGLIEACAVPAHPRDKLAYRLTRAGELFLAAQREKPGVARAGPSEVLD